MNIEIGRRYIFRIQVNEHLLTYTGKVIDYDDGFVTFLDKFGTRCSYHKNSIVSYEELKGLEQTEPEQNSGSSSKGVQNDN